MASEYSFSVMPSVSISRSRFNRKSQHKTTFNLGAIVPIYVDEVLPGDTRTFDMAALVRMSTPIAPIMDNIYLDVYAFFVPNRIVWDHWKEFMGENNTSAGIPLGSYSVPFIADNSTTASPDVISNAAYMGIPQAVTGIAAYNQISALPFRGLAKIYNRWFRNQNVDAPLAVQTGDTNEVIVGELSNAGYSSFAFDSNQVLVSAKLPDYFTKALPYAQKGASVKVPLGATAVVKYTSTGHTGQAALVKQDGTIIADGTPSQTNGHLALSGSTAYFDPKGSLVADLSQATAATINELRYAFQLQKLLEKDALYGTRYWEILAAHFGVTAPDASLQDPEYLGGQRININIDQVLSTAGYTNTTSTLVGQPGGNSVSGWKGSLFTKSFVEHGYVIIVATARHDQTYCQGINRMWTRSSRYDFYFPVFANLGAQDIKRKEIYATGSSGDEALFGYQEAWAEYRYKPSIATGLLNPTATGTLDYWTLTNKFSSIPTLGSTFIHQDRDNLKRALVTGITGPDFVADFYFQDVAVRPMPVYSIPGLIDHH